MIQTINDLCKVVFMTSGCMLFIVITTGVLDWFPWELLTTPILYLSLALFGALVLASVTKGRK